MVDLYLAQNRMHSMNHVITKHIDFWMVSKCYAKLQSIKLALFGMLRNVLKKKSHKRLMNSKRISSTNKINKTESAAIYIKITPVFRCVLQLLINLCTAFLFLLNNSSIHVNFYHARGILVKPLSLIDQGSCIFKYYNIDN